MTPKRQSAFLSTLILGIATIVGGCGTGAAQNQVRVQSPRRVEDQTSDRVTNSKQNHYTLQNMDIVPGSVTLNAGDTYQLAASGMGSDNQMHDVTQHVTWTSSDTTIATVDKGLVTAVGQGNATITASRGPQSSTSVTVNDQTTQGKSVPTTFFSMSFHGRNNWPSVTFSGARLWDTGTYWSSLNTADGVYDWHVLDNWIADAQTNKVDLVYTFGFTPTWASSQPNLVCSAGTNIPLGSCVAPNDLNSDGTGTNKHWKDYVTAVVTHAAGKIKVWEIWNEPTVTAYWQGTNAQMVRMAKDAYGIIKGIDPTAQVTTPSPSTGINGVADWMDAYLAAGGGPYADIITFHGYSWSSKPGIWPKPEDIVQLIDNLNAVLTARGQSGKPLWCTEGSWGGTTGNGFTDQDLHSAFVARHYLLQQSKGVARYYWYAWDNGTWGGMWDPNTGTNQTATAYSQVQNWMVGSIPSGKCSVSGTTWTCNYTRSGGYQAQAIWDTAQSCSAGVCTTTKQTVGSQYIKYSDIKGKTFTISGKVPVGAKPIWLTNQ